MFSWHTINRLLTGFYWVKLCVADIGSRARERGWSVSCLDEMFLLRISQQALVEDSI